MSKLRDFRKSKEMTQADLARKVGVRKPTISRIESGARVPSVSLIRRLIEFSGGELTADDLLATPQPERAA